MDIEYIKAGDYYVPNLIPNKEPEEPLTKYGQMRKNYLKTQKEWLFGEMLLLGTLKEHCLEIQHQADERMDYLIEAMAKNQGVTEELKATDQMKWVRMMNNIRNAAEEIVLSELIYV